MRSRPILPQSVRNVVSARISQAGVNPDEEITDMVADQRGRLMTNLYAQAATYQSALAAAATAIQPSLAAFLQ
jgi:hypothetical protein